MKPASEHPEDNDLRHYRDVLALTGLLAPFVEAARRDLSKKDRATIDRELSKLIEHVERTPQEFCYDLAQVLVPYGQSIPSAVMSSRQDTQAITREALKLLDEAGVEVSSTQSAPDDAPNRVETSEKASDRVTYRLTIETLLGVYDYLYERRYHTRKERYDLAYQLKLSLYARFPRLIAAQKNDKES